MLRGIDGLVQPRRILKVGTGDAGHPLPDDRSVRAGEESLAIARAQQPGDLLLVLLSGGASAMLEAPAAATTLAGLRERVSAMLRAGATIGELNAARSALSRIKGGKLALATPARVLTLAISDVVGDDPAVIGSGPTFLPGDPRAAVRIIGSLREAVAGAAAAAAALGYEVRLLEQPTVGEARQMARPVVREACTFRLLSPGPLCVIGGGETTVTVHGSGRGGRNMELALAMVPLLDDPEVQIVALCGGSDGIDGPTDAAGAIVDNLTARRARDAHMSVAAYLSDNNSYAFFEALDDLHRPGPTGTNVGDLQIILIH